jgi:undecaprenyl-diphosphatase
MELLPLPGRRRGIRQIGQGLGPPYHDLRVPEFTFRAVDGPTVLAHDGEVGTEVTKASFSVRYRALPVYRRLP